MTPAPFSLLLTTVAPSQWRSIQKARPDQITAASRRHQGHQSVSRVWSHLVTSGAQLLRAHGGNFPVVLMPNRRRQGSGARQSSQDAAWLLYASRAGHPAPFAE